MRRSLALLILAILLAPALPASSAESVRASFASLHPAATLRLGKTADWVIAADGSIWVGGSGPFAVHRIDPATNRQTALAPLPGEPCAGLAAGFASLWTPLCGKPNALAQIDLKTGRLTRVLPLGPAAAEGGVAAGGDSVWMVTTATGALVRIDPRTGLARQTVKVPPGSYNPAYADGVVWVTGHDAGVVTAVDAATGAILAVIPVGEGPRFLTAGDGALWVLLQGSGEVVRIDMARRRVAARIPAGLSGPGGDIGFGAGKVWATLSGIPLTKIDAGSNRIQRQWAGPGGDSLAYAFGSVWLTNYKAGTVSRYPAAVLGAP